MLITLSWPHRKLSPNARVHWAEKSRLARSYRQEGFYATRAERAALTLENPLVALTFHPPDARHRDLDNMISAMKSALDGIADAIGVDDHKWRLSAQVGEQMPGGKVVVQVTE